MRYLLITSVLFLLAITLIGCGTHSEATREDGQIDAINDEIYQEYRHEQEPKVSEVVNTLFFSSFEEFLESYRAVTFGRAYGELTRLAESVNLASMGTFYLPIGIPETFQLYRIDINENFVIIWYLPKDFIGLDDAFIRALSQGRDFQFSFSRWDKDDVDLEMSLILHQNNATEENLINEKYLFAGQNLLFWSSDNAILLMYTPMNPLPSDGVLAPTEISAVLQPNNLQADDIQRRIVADTLSITETININLRDENMVNALIADMN